MYAKCVACKAVDNDKNGDEIICDEYIISTNWENAAIERVTVKDSSTIGKINLLADVCRANKAFADRNKLGLANKR